MKHIKQVIFTYIVSSDEKTYCTSAAGVTFFPSCRRLFFRCLVRNFQILDAFNKWIPTFPASLTKISFKRHTKALSRTLTPFHKKETTPTDKHTHTQLSQTKKNKSVPTKTRAPTNKNVKVPNVFLKRSGRFFFFPSFKALQEFDPDFIFISAGFDGHEAWGGHWFTWWGFVDGTGWEHDFSQHLKETSSIYVVVSNVCIFLPPLGERIQIRLTFF